MASSFARYFLIGSMVLVLASCVKSVDEKRYEVTELAMNNKEVFRDSILDPAKGIHYISVLPKEDDTNRFELVIKYEADVFKDLDKFESFLAAEGMLMIDTSTVQVPVAVDSVEIGSMVEPAETVSNDEPVPVPNIPAAQEPVVTEDTTNQEESAVEEEQGDTTQL